ncbi:MAG: hypothetical protein H6492_00845 [Candidatus Paracaedibacteraceae bacterium]|nr:hypothetical protein [Candidatus Paracaedibacteraceae bacterium]
MNKKLFTGIGFGILLCLGALTYTTTPDARPTAKADKNLENLTKCAADKNPAFLAHVLSGAFEAYAADTARLIKEDKVREMSKPRTALLHVISFLLKESRHFSPIYKHVEHQAAFDKELDKEIQKLFKKEVRQAKDPKMQGEIVRDYREFVKALEKDGVKGLSRIVSPEKEKKKAARRSKKNKKQGGVGSRIKGFFGSAKAKIASKFHHENPPEEQETADDSDDSEGDYADDEGEGEGEEEYADDAGEGEEEYADDAGEGEGEEEYADDAGEGEGEEEYADDEGEEEYADDEGEEEYADDAGEGDYAEEDEQYTEED